ncbi:MAG: hypothetical protein R3301_08255 [Saprospiraceae bacterium]|nr:hypothetical protein [Saprospiraceae bacterium]
MVEYPVPLRSVLLALALAFVALAAWEIHWRGEDYRVAPEDDKHLWAEQRAKVERLGPEDVVLLGSSRILFDIQLDEWEAEAGRRPVMLAAAGTTPLPVLIDLVENSAFNGTIVLGITPPLYFSPPGDEHYFWRRISNWVKHYHTRTYADRFNHLVAKAPQGAFAFLNATEETFFDELDLRTRLETLVAPRRVPAQPPFPIFQYLDQDRNVTMWRADTDTALARMVTDFWSFVIQPPDPMPPPEAIEELRQAIIGMSVEQIEKFRARGGKVILVRCPSQDVFRAAENGGFPREKYWDPLVEATGCPAYHFEDYDFMNQYTLPEWSHLNSQDAKQFTTDLVRQMKEDGVL